MPLLLLIRSLEHLDPTHIYIYMDKVLELHDIKYDEIGQM